MAKSIDLFVDIAVDQIVVVSVMQTVAPGGKPIPSVVKPVLIVDGMESEMESKLNQGSAMMRRQAGVDQTIAFRHVTPTGTPSFSIEARLLDVNTPVKVFDNEGKETTSYKVSDIAFEVRVAVL